MPRPSDDVARASQVTNESAPAWSTDRTWVAQGIPDTLTRYGMTPADQETLYLTLDGPTRVALPKIVMVGLMSEVDLSLLHLWARAGFLTLNSPPPTGRGRTSRPVSPRTDWTTKANRYVAAAGGNQRIAALAAAAGISVEEVAANRDSFTEEALETLVALR